MLCYSIFFFLLSKNGLNGQCHEIFDPRFFIKTSVLGPWEFEFRKSFEIFNLHACDRRKMLPL
jgi:hypothetical protein